MKQDMSNIIMNRIIANLTRGLPPCDISVRLLRTIPMAFLRYAYDTPTLCLRYTTILLLMLVMGVNSVWGQTDFSGVWYIANETNHSNSDIKKRWYLVPGADPQQQHYADAYFHNEFCNKSGKGDYTGDNYGDPEKPFLTTYQTNRDNNSIWTIVSTGDGFYNIIHAKTGRYIVYEPPYKDAKHRKSMHLESTTNPGDNAKFTISGSLNGPINISPIGITSGNMYFNPAVGQGNYPQYYGTGDYFHAGMIGLYNNAGDKSQWYLEGPVTPAPTITNNLDGTISITGTGTIYYTTNGENPTTSSETYSSAITLTDDITIIKAMAKDGDNYESYIVTYELPKCDKPVISISSGTVTITSTTVGASIHYTTDNTPPSSLSPLYEGTFSLGDIAVIRAITIKAGYVKSDEAFYADFITISSSTEITNMQGLYRLASGFTSSETIGTSSKPFRGTIDGQMNTISGINHPLVAYAENATIKNVILDNVSISGGTNVGAICNEARGDTRIYNCGVLASNSTANTDEDGYTYLTNCSSTISGSNYVGSIVGLLDGNSRVINCFSFANVSGGSEVGGIVGHNNVATTASNLKTMVMNCMFYGEVSGTSIAPIYNGEIITNVDDNKGVSNFNYFRLEASYIQNTDITKVYNCALGAETRFLQRFEFFRHLLNSNRELAAWWATGNAANKDEMMKWVMEPSQIGTTTPYPILKSPGEYASVVNYIPNETAYDEINRNKGRMLTNLGTNGKLAVTIQSGSGGATGADIINSSLSLTITDKDFEHFNFNYGKVQLPYYNDVGTKNYTNGKVVTGWKIVSISDGTSSYSTGDDVTYSDGKLTATPYNFADRKCTDKDKYSVSERVFNQGAYWDVPEGVTAITIEPYWGKAVYLSDAYYDVVYNTGMNTAYPVKTVGDGQHYTNGESKFNDQLVYTSMDNAVNALTPSGTVYDNAVVLVGNYHEYSGSGKTIRSGKPYTITSVDLDDDNEPDYSFMWRFDGRTKLHPVRYDFLNVIGLGMAQKSTGGTGSYNFGIPQPLDWFEVTNTALFRVTQFEYSPDNRSKKPIILQGGVIEQLVTQQNDAGDRVSYFHVGGNAWFKEFHRGSHQDNANKSTPHPPVSVTGGDYNKFYLTGLYQSQAKIYDDNAECYINGGRFGEMAGAGMEGIGTSDGKGNITWVIDNADIKEFYGGGINFAKPAHGNIHTIISNSHVNQFCGGPKFGDMESGRTVITTATDCTFGTYFGAGFGGNSYNRYAPANRNNVINLPGQGKVNNVAKNLNSWNDWVADEYKQSYSSTYSGISTQIDYQFIPMSSNIENVARLWVEYVNFSLATCHNVTSSLTGCKVTGNFYGGGSLGKVDGNVISTLTNCEVTGNVYGAGFSASLPTVEVMNLGGFQTEPYYYTDLGTYRTAVFPKTTTYTWQKGNSISIDTQNHILYTKADLSSLGTVTGDVTLTIDGSSTKVEGDVYGGGESSNATGNSIVNVLEGTVSGNTYGGGALANVGGDTKVLLLGGTINGDVYGGCKGRLEEGTSGQEGYINPIEATVGNATVYLNGMEATDYDADIYGNLELAHASDTDPYTVENSKKGCIVKGDIFGCNNLNGSPKGNVTVHIYATQNEAATQIANATASDTQSAVTNAKIGGRYDVNAVYGGGNLAAYIPSDGNLSTATTSVIIDGCDRTSIQTVYGGGNAASTPATSVTVNGTYEINELFGGGNGLDALPDGKPNPGANVGYKNYTIYEENGGQIVAKDDPNYDTKEERINSDIIYGTGAASVNIYGGNIHAVFGGSNTKGNVRISAVTLLDDQEGCHFNIDEAYGGGKSAPMDAEAQLHMSCIPGLKAAYGGAQDADILGDVTLNITNGNFDRVFGGNNISGTIGGTITVNIEETGCKPVIIGQLYGGGNLAAYTAPTGQHGPTVNVKSFTSIGEVYGGGYGEGAIVTGDTYVNINEVLGDKASTEQFMKEKVDTVKDPAAQTTGDDKVSKNTGVTKTFKDGSGENANTISVEIPLHMSGKIGVINNVFGGGNAAKVNGNTNVNIGTLSTVDYVTKGTGTAIPVVGADIRGNVYGGGNNAEVTGNTNVTIGKKTTN